MDTTEDWDLFHVHLFPNSSARLILKNASSSAKAHIITNPYFLKSIVFLIFTFFHMTFHIVKFPANKCLYILKAQENHFNSRIKETFSRPHIEARLSQIF